VNLGRPHHSSGFPAATLAWAVACSACAGYAAETPTGSTPEEIELGKEAAEQVAKRYKFIDDKAQLDKLNHMVKVLAAKSERPAIEYQVKILDEDTMNAFTLPGGYVYVTKGLLKSVRSDHELAAVIAHELAHNARMHALRLIAKQRKLQLWQLLAVVGVAAGGSAGAEVGQMGLLIIDGILNGYSQEAEREADEGALLYLIGTEYSPVGLLTFMEHLADLEQRSPPSDDPGIYQTHPLTPERVRAIGDRLRELRIPLDRRVSRGGLVAKVEKTPEAPEAPEAKDVGARVTLGTVTVCELAGEDGIRRATTAAERLNEGLRANLGLYAVGIGHAGGDPALLWGGTVIATVTEAETHVTAQARDDVARQWASNLRTALWQESVTTGS